jgi:hypothetical protein
MAQKQPQTAGITIAPLKNKNGRLLLWSAGLSAGAIIAHAIDAPDHLTEWWGFTTFFIVAASFQLFLGLVLLLQPWKYDQTGDIRQNPEYYGRTFYLLGIILSASIVMVYVISRTSGLPLIAPEAIRKSVSLLSLVPAIENIPLLYCLIMLRIRTGKMKPDESI